MKSFLLPLAAGLCLFQSASGLEISQQDDVYLFLGVEVSAETKSGFAPIISANRRGLFVETGSGVKRFTYNANYRISPSYELTKNVVDVRDMDVKFDYARRNELEAQAMSDVMWSENQAELEIARLTRPGQAPTPQAEQRISEIQEEQEEYAESVRSFVENGDFDSDTLRDTVFYEMHLVSPVDISNAFCVVSMQYTRPRRSDWDEGNARVSVARVAKVGDLRANIPSKVKFRFRVPEGFLKEANTQFYLLDGDGKNIATTISSGLRHLSEEEKAKLIEKARAEG